MKRRAIRIDGNIAYVPLTQGYEAIIDSADAELIGKNNWCVRFAKGPVYAVRGTKKGGKCAEVRMHRVIAGAPETHCVDHVNGNGLDNRRSNLRVATTSQNICNARIRSDNKIGLKGVALHRQTGKFRARIKANGRDIHLGLFETADAAHYAYSEAARIFFGDFARTA